MPLGGNTSSVTHMQITLDHQFLMTNSKDGQAAWTELVPHDVAGQSR